MRRCQWGLVWRLTGMLWFGGTAWAAAADPASADQHWVASWGSAQMTPEAHNLLPAEDWRDSSLRQIVRVSLGGSRVRVRVSNVFGTTPLTLEAASVALSDGPGRPSVQTGSVRPLAFSGRSGVMIPAGGEYYSDPVELQHAAGADLAITMHFKGEPVRQTGHPGSRTTSFVTRGNRVAEVAWPDATRVVRWYQLADVEVEAALSVGAVVAIGDSITDGHGATTDGNNRWTDVLAGRIQRERAAPMAVVNTGIGGGRLLRDGLGPNLVSRFERDVLLRSGVTHAIVLIGINDLGGQHRNGDAFPESRARLIEDLKLAFRQIVERAHAQKICVVGGTITPYLGSDYYRPNAENDADRRALNEWIRSSQVFDAVADFDIALRDAARPDRLRTEYDVGDGLHPSPAGFRAMADAVPLKALESCSWRR